MTCRSRRIRFNKLPAPPFRDRMEFMLISTTKMTAQQFLQLGEDPPGVRLELVNGSVAVSPSPIPDHSTVIIKLITLLENYNEANDLGELYQDVDTILDRFNVRRKVVVRFGIAHAPSLSPRGRAVRLASNVLTPTD